MAFRTDTATVSTVGIAFDGGSIRRSDVRGPFRIELTSWWPDDFGNAVRLDPDNGHPYVAFTRSYRADQFGWE